MTLYPTLSPLSPPLLTAPRLRPYSSVMNLIGSHNLSTGCDELTVATDRQRHEDQEYSSPRAHCKCNDPGICAFLFYAYSCSDPGPGLGGV